MTGFILGIAFSLGFLSLLAGAVILYTRSKTKNEGKIRMLARQYQTMMDSAEREIPMEVLASPEFISSRMEFRKIDAIERELVEGDDKILARRLLKEYFSGDDQWVRARAAKALYRIDPKAAGAELQALLKNPSAYTQLPAIWALGEIATTPAVATLLPLVWSKDSEIQEASIRCLVHMDARDTLPPDCVNRVKKVLKEVRFKTDFIL